MANPAADFPTSAHTATDVSAFASLALGATTPTHTALEGKQEAELAAITKHLLGTALNVKEYGATGDGSTDDTAAIQDAIDAAQAEIDSFDGAYVGCPEVFFPPGAYKVTSTITWKSATLRGHWPWQSAALVWGGSAGGTLLQKDASAGGMTIAHCIGLGFLAGANEPATFIDVDAVPVNEHGVIEHCWFNGCSGDAIKVGAVVKLNWHHLRFDEVGGFAIRMTVPTATAYRSFALRDIHYGHNRSSGNGTGVICVDNSLNSNFGQVIIDGMRVEVNTQFGGNNAIFTEIDGDNTPRIEWTVNNLVYYDEAEQADDVLLYRDGPDATGAPVHLHLSEFYGNVSAIIGGDLMAAQPIPAASSIWRHLVLGDFGYYGVDDSGVFTQHIRSAAQGNCLHVYKDTETYSRFNVSTTGYLNFGSGSGATDTNLYRAGVNLLKTDDKLLTTAGLGMGNSAAATTPGSCVKKIEVFDDTGASLGYLAVYSAIT